MRTATDIVESFRKSLRTICSRFVEDDIELTLLPGPAAVFGAGDILVASDFKARINGMVVCRLSKSDASFISASFFGIDAGGNGGIITDSISEFLNQLLGVVKRNFGHDPEGFLFSIPRALDVNKIPGGHFSGINSINSIKARISDDRAVFLDIYSTM
jgi:hypothetical protein